MKKAMVAVVGAVCAVQAMAYTVEAPQQAKPWEATAVKELKEYLAQVVRGDVTIGASGSAAFHVGDTTFAAEHGLGANALADEEWVIKSFGRDVVLNGGGTRGCLYAVYHFLEDNCGIRWWSDGEEDVPAAKPLAFAALDARGKPKFLYRDIYRTKTSSPYAAVRNRVNGNGDSRIPAELGGGCTFGPPYHCHTWDRLLPFSKYGKEHPEWYSLRDGKRVGGQDHGQLCFAAEGLVNAFVPAVEAAIAKGEREAKAQGIPAPKLYDISMNDNDKYCQCAACRASQAKYGVSGDQLLFENEVANRLGKNHPDQLFSVFAYYAGEAVPSNGVRAADNVVVKLCNTRQNMAAGIGEPDNQFMHDQIQNWGRAAKNLFVWEYAITFYANTLGFPFPSEFYIGEKLKYYADHGVMGLLVEFEKPEISDFYDIKYHLLAKFLENPYLDAQKVVEESFCAYFGEEIGRMMLAMRQNLDRLRRERKGFVTWFPKSIEFTYIDNITLQGMEYVFDKAEKMAAGNEKLLRRVRKARKGTDLMFRERDVAGRFVVAREEGVAETAFLNFPAESPFYNLHRNSDAKIVDDAAASTGKAIFVPSKNHPYNTLPFQLGVYSPKLLKGLKSRGWEKPLGEGYQWYDLGDVALNNSFYIYFTRSWQIQLGISHDMVVDHTCGIKARVRCAPEGFYIDRTVVIPK